MMRVPGAPDMMLYQPKHRVAFTCDFLTRRLRWPASAVGLQSLREAIMGTCERKLVATGHNSRASSSIPCPDLRGGDGPGEGDVRRRRVRARRERDMQSPSRSGEQASSRRHSECQHVVCFPGGLLEDTDPDAVPLTVPAFEVVMVKLPANGAGSKLPWQTRDMKIDISDRGPPFVAHVDHEVERVASVRVYGGGACAEDVRLGEVTQAHRIVHHKGDGRTGPARPVDIGGHAVEGVGAVRPPSAVVPAADPAEVCGCRTRDDQVA